MDVSKLAMNVFHVRQVTLIYAFAEAAEACGCKQACHADHLSCTEQGLPGGRWHSRHPGRDVQQSLQFQNAMLKILSETAVSVNNSNMLESAILFTWLYSHPPLPTSTIRFGDPR
jgi:hypothetical protein